MRDVDARVDHGGKRHIAVMSSRRTGWRLKKADAAVIWFAMKAVQARIGLHPPCRDLPVSQGDNLGFVSHQMTILTAPITACQACGGGRECFCAYAAQILD